MAAGHPTGTGARDRNRAAAAASRPASRPGRWLQQAMRAHQRGDLDVAERLYRRILALRASQPDALHYYGVLQHDRGRSEEAVALIERALVQSPGYPDAHNNLGNVHKECGRVKDAEACYRQALECDPGHHNALCNLAVVLEAQARKEEAFDCYGRLLQLAPEHAHGHFLLGLFLRNNAEHREHMEQSVECFRSASRLDVRNLRALEALGVTLYLLGRHDEATAIYRDWLQRDPDSPIARHMLASCGGAVAPARADDEYVRRLFDGFAASFDEQLVGYLDYRAPQLLADAIADGPDAGLEVLDAGCGTGLCGPLLRNRARTLVGVDLSEGMVAAARRRGGYDRLVVDELTAFIDSRQQAWDLIVSADTLVYFGDLGKVAAASWRALRPGGRLAFTVEALDGDADLVALGASGRYRHGRAHLERVLAAAGFAGIRIEPGELRKEAGEAVRGWVVVARRG